jgi:hypothetical protein
MMSYEPAYVGRQVINDEYVTRLLSMFYKK